MVLRKERATSEGWRKREVWKEGKEGDLGVNKGERVRGVKRRDKKKSYVEEKKKGR